MRSKATRKDERKQGGQVASQQRDEVSIEYQPQFKAQQGRCDLLDRLVSRSANLLGKLRTAIERCLMALNVCLHLAGYGGQYRRALVQISGG